VPATFPERSASTLAARSTVATCAWAAGFDDADQLWIGADPDAAAHQIVLPAPEQRERLRHRQRIEQP
jgi:hypothetical protein